MSSREVVKQQPADLTTTNDSSDVVKKTTESVSSIGANISGAFAGAFHAGGGASSRTTKTERTSGGDDVVVSEDRAQ